MYLLFKAFCVMNQDLHILKMPESIFWQLNKMNDNYFKNINI